MFSVLLKHYLELYHGRIDARISRNSNTSSVSVGDVFTGNGLMNDPPECLVDSMESLIDEWVSITETQAVVRGVERKSGRRRAKAV